MKAPTTKQLPAILAIGIFLGGCGGGSTTDQSTAGDKTIAKAAFIKQGTEICEATVGKITDAILRPLEEQEKEGKASESSRADLEEELITTVAIPELRAELEQIEELGVPAGDGQRVEAILDSFDDLIEETEADPQKLVGTNQAFAKPAKMAEAYGLRTCPYG